MKLWPLENKSDGERAPLLSAALREELAAYLQEHCVEEPPMLRCGAAFAGHAAPLCAACPPPDAAEMCREDAAAPPELEELLGELDAGFSEMLLLLIDRSGKRDAEVYKKAGVDRKLFSKIRSNPHYRPSKQTAVAFAVALELSLAETEDLLGRAGFALSRSSPFDMILRFFIERGQYDPAAINEALLSYDQPLLGV